LKLAIHSKLTQINIWFLIRLFLLLVALLDGLISEAIDIIPIIPAIDICQMTIAAFIMTIILLGCLNFLKGKKFFYRELDNWESNLLKILISKPDSLFHFISYLMIANSIGIALMGNIYATVGNISIATALLSAILLPYYFSKRNKNVGKFNIFVTLIIFFL